MSKYRWTYSSWLEHLKCQWGWEIAVQFIGQPEPQPQLKSQPELEAKEAINFMEFFSLVVLFFFVSNHKSTTSRQPRRVKFDMQAYFNPTKRNLKKKIGVTWPPPPPKKNLTLKRLTCVIWVLCILEGWNSTSKLMSTKLKEILRKNWPYPIPLNHNSS